MSVAAGDTIVVIDGPAEHFYWKGQVNCWPIKLFHQNVQAFPFHFEQNQRSFDIGTFPRRIVDNLAGKRVKDISKPLKNSFLHTGHGSHKGRSWGTPGQIDEMYLKNPMTPPGMLLFHMFQNRFFNF